MSNSAKGIQREIKVKSQKLGTVTSIKYLGATASDDGSKLDFFSPGLHVTVDLRKLKWERSQHNSCINCT